jgi:hypothetical protein
MFAAAKPNQKSAGAIGRRNGVSEKRMTLIYGGSYAGEYMDFSREDNMVRCATCKAPCEAEELFDLPVQGNPQEKENVCPACLERGFETGKYFVAPKEDKAEARGI